MQFRRIRLMEFEFQWSRDLCAVGKKSLQNAKTNELSPQTCCKGIIIIRLWRLLFSRVLSTQTLCSLDGHEGASGFSRGSQLSSKRWDPHDPRCVGLSNDRSQHSDSPNCFFFGRHTLTLQVHVEFNQSLECLFRVTWSQVTLPWLPIPGACCPRIMDLPSRGKTTPWISVFQSANGRKTTQHDINS